MSEMDHLSNIDDVAEAFSVDDYLYFYGDFLTPERSEAETQAAVELLNMFPPMRVLDAACGFGRIANRLAARGFRVTGVELLDGFLDAARAEANQIGARIDYRQGDIRALAFESEFNRALLMFNSFGYFSDEENLRVMRGVAQAVKPGGRIGLDMMHRDGVLGNFQPHSVLEKNGNWMINRFSFDVLTGRLLNERVVIRGGVRKDRPFSQRLYSLTEMRALFATCGLQLEAAYAEWDGSPLRVDSPAMVLVAYKPE